MTHDSSNSYWFCALDIQLTVARSRFPPKNAKPNLSIAESMLPTDVTFPSAALARSEIWDEPARAKLRIPRFKKKDLDERRSKVVNEMPHQHRVLLLTNHFPESHPRHAAKCTTTR